MKEKKDLRIVFMGTPPFAVAQLDALLNAGYHIAAVVTATEKPAGRGKKLTPSASRSTPKHTTYPFCSRKNCGTKPSCNS